MKRFVSLRLVAIISGTVVLVASGVLFDLSARATVSQVDGTIVPTTNSLQTQLETSEGISNPNDPNYLDATKDAYLFPQIFLPPEYGSGRTVHFEDIQEQAGYENSFGWYNVGDPNHLYVIFDCSPVNNEPGDATDIDFDVQFDNGRWDGGFIGFYLITPQGNTSSPHVNCGDFTPPDLFGHMYYTETELNGDGDYVHFLVFTSKAHQNRFYFAFEDLFRGGDNDFTDMTLLVEGLTPPCVPNPEICDGQDNDCDGQTDEDPVDAGGPCGTDEGECQQGIQVCTDSHLVCQGAVGPQPEICDNLDNDCNGTTDDNLIDEGSACGTNVGTCSTGHTVCTDGHLVCQGEVGPQPETCNGLDDDCNGTPDDNLTDDGQPCGSNVGQCQQGVTVCYQHHLICQGEVKPSPEVCDNIDNNCDNDTDNNPIDEGATCGTDVGECSHGTTVCSNGALTCQGAVGPQPEVCDNLDNDCNNAIDDNPIDVGGTCGKDEGECQTGTMVCSNGAPICQGAVGPQSEVCDNLDNDCDGHTDNNPTDAGGSCGSGVGECQTGIEVCVNGALVCQGSIGPQPEVCDGNDNDCNGVVDDNPVDEGGPCGENKGECRPGIYQCIGGQLVCQGAIGPQPEVCDGRDNDCDGVVDNDDPGGGGVCGITNEGICSLGAIHCIAGALQCDGAVGPVSEICDCVDNDCDGQTDNGDLCPPGSQCVDCACRISCSEGEFQCPGGMACQDGYCVQTACYGVSCPEGQICQDGQCVDLCDIVQCTDDEICEKGQCIENSCYGLGCPDGQVCRDATCIDDPCAQVTCSDHQFCRQGECVNTCEHVVCSAGQSCKDGICSQDPCVDKDCGWGNRCRDGVCEPDPCSGVDCGKDRVCSDGQCVDDPCAQVTCPLGGTCTEGQCQDPSDYVPGRSGQQVLAIGGGGCSCDSAGESGQGLWLVLLALFALVWKRRKRLVAAVATVFILGGCNMNPYQFQDIDGYSPQRNDSGVHKVDAGPCEVTNGGTELCDGLDNDCDGLTDEDFNLALDSDNCGSCGNSCQVPGGFSYCKQGKCVFQGCAPGYIDLDHDMSDGCEYACMPSNGGQELCDGLDNDCDGETDEDFDLMNDESNCGSCGTACALTNADSECQEGHCRLTRCHDGFLDLDQDENDGCEYACVATNGGVEICDGLDNDCNGSIDDNVDTSSNPANCGSCGHVCSAPNATMDCVLGSCVLISCKPGYVNLDNAPGNGCEYTCTETNSGTEVCDGVDNDCDGVADNNLTDVGGSCGRDEGECQHGSWACSSGILICSGGVGHHVEVCDGKDNDCDSVTDNAPVDVGGPCGTGVGQCQRGTMVCQGGQPLCQGGQGPVAETCNGLDDDCDGVADNHLIDTGGVCGTNQGACQQGTWACSSGILVCSGSINPQPEICDGVDNDCDGQPDNDTLDTGDLCGSSVGECQVGVTVCPNGQVICQGAIDPQPEICDGKDNDCNGFVDDDPQGVGVQCGVSNTGECRYGTTACTNHHLICEGNVDPSAEVCDGLDNDCDSTTDLAGCVTEDSTDQRLDITSNPGAANSIQVDLAADGNNVYVVWLDTRNGNADIYYACSSDGGVTWSADLRLDTGSSDSVKPRVFADPSGWVYVVYTDFRTGGDRDIYFRRAAGCGAAFDAEKRLDTGNVDSLNLDLTADGAGRVAVVWEDFVEGSGNTNPQHNVYLAASSDHGQTFTSPLRVNQVPSDPTHALASLPRVAIGQSGRILVTWMDQRDGAADIYLNSTDDMATFGTSDLRLDTDAAGAAASKYPRMGTDGAGHVYVIWQDLRRVPYSDIYLARSVDNGTSWLADRQVDSDKGDANSYEPSFALGQTGTLYMAWQDFREGLPMIRVASSIDYGATIRSSVRASAGPGYVSDVQLASGGSKVFVAFADDRDGLRDIYLNYSLDSGLNFQPADVRLDGASPPGSAESFSPRLMTDGATDGYVVWVDTRTDDVHGDIYFNAVRQ
ncbi:MAG: DUF4114 domain-containing protein [Deltaproteobacteria bacterium]|nr:DUF4114 domain-containing protein [Deltaproteobacteria bacterium]